MRSYRKNMNTTIDTRAEGRAAVKETAPLLRQKILRELFGLAAGLTPDEAAAKLGVSILSVRPRFTELKAQGLIRKNGLYRLNVSGVRAAAYEVT